jgi:hypothetical protein
LAVLLLRNKSGFRRFWLMHYNFCRVHRTLRVTPAMEAGIADRVWGIEDVVALLEAERAILAA